MGLTSDTCYPGNCAPTFPFPSHQFQGPGAGKQYFLQDPTQAYFSVLSFPGQKGEDQRGFIQGDGHTRTLPGS